MARWGMMCIGRVRGWREGSKVSIFGCRQLPWPVKDNDVGRLGAYAESEGYLVDGQVLSKLLGYQLLISSGQRSDALENVLVFSQGHFAGVHDRCYRYPGSAQFADGHIPLLRCVRGAGDHGDEVFAIAF